MISGDCFSFHVDGSISDFTQDCKENLTKLMTNSTVPENQKILGATPTNFRLILVGKIELLENSNQLTLLDKTILPVAKTKLNFPPQLQAYRVTPSITSTGVITNLSIDSYTSPELEDLSPDSCFLIGRIVQVSKKNQLVQFKVTQSGAKPLKLMLTGSSADMKVGQLWQVEAVRLGDRLQIQRGRQLEIESQGDINSTDLRAIRPTPSPSSTSSPPLTSPPMGNQGHSSKVLAFQEKALAALVRQTELEDWILNSPSKRQKMWEWEAVHRLTQQKARVQVKTLSKQASVYCYPQPSRSEVSQDANSDLSPPQEARLEVTPLGAARGIGASCFQILIGPYELVLDCGTRFKGDDPLPQIETLHNPNLLLVSHAHQDHLGAVPVFHSRFPQTRMICTPGTRELAHVMLRDCLKVQQLNEDAPPLFDDIDLERTLFYLETYKKGVDFFPLPGLKVRFINAGHILGAACIYLEYGERKLLYTGDYNTTSSHTTTGLRLADLPTADILITESTYGGDNHPARKTQETALLEAIAAVVQAGGNVLIPAFALGRAQEILLAIRTSALFHKLKVPVYVDGLVRAVTDVFRERLELLPSTVQNLVKNSSVEPFFNPQGNPPIIPISHVRERPLAIAKPSVIVASSGMLTGGASVYYGRVLLERENAAIFISGYTDEESPGRLLQNLNRGDEIELEGQKLTVRAQIQRFNLSAHADKIGLTQVINKVSPKQLVLIHGCGNALYELADSGDLKSKYYIHIPAVGEKVIYGDYPDHISQRQRMKIELPSQFELTVESEYGGAWLHVPEQVANEDPRWQNLASSGLLKASWEGESLKLTPITHHHLLREAVQQKALTSQKDCCANCEFFGAGSCQSPDSPLFNFSVDPTGICPEFTPSR